MKLFLQSIFSLTALLIFTITLNAQTAEQNEISNFIEKELGISVEVTDHGKGDLMFGHNRIFYFVYLDKNYIRISGSEMSVASILLEKASNSKLEKKVIQSYKDILNEINKKFHITKVYWNYNEKPVVQYFPSFSTSLRKGDNNSWQSEFRTTVTSTEECAKLLKTRFMNSLSKIMWDVSQNETDPLLIQEAIFWAEEILDMKKDADRTYLYALLLFKSGQTLLALDKINETIELCKKEGQNYDLSTKLKAELVSIIYKNEDGLYNMRVKDQEWRVNNLRTIKFRNGDKIFHAKTDEEWKDAVEKGIPAWCHYNNDNIYGFKLGKLYNWYAVNDPRGLAPKGWHIPSIKEWEVLTKYFGEDNVGKELKSKDNWMCDYTSNGNGDNYRNFNAFPGGLRWNDGRFAGIGNSGRWWTTTEEDKGNAYNFILSDDKDGSYGGTYSKGNGYSVRCIKD